MEEPEGEDLDAGQGQDGLSENPFKVSSSLPLEAERFEVEEKESVSEITTTVIPPDHQHELDMGMIDSSENDNVLRTGKPTIPGSPSHHVHAICSTITPGSDSLHAVQDQEPAPQHVQAICSTITPGSDSLHAVQDQEPAPQHVQAICSTITPGSDSLHAVQDQEPAPQHVQAICSTITPGSDSLHAVQDQEPAPQHVQAICSTITPGSDSLHEVHDQEPAPQHVQAICSTITPGSDSLHEVHDQEPAPQHVQAICSTPLPENDSIHAVQDQEPAPQHGDTMLACSGKGSSTLGTDVQISEGKPELNSPFLSSSAPSYLSETTDRAVHNESLLSGKEDLNSHCPSHSSLLSNTSSFHQSPSKSKIELNVSVENSTDSPSEQNTLLSSKSSLNFQLSDYMSRGREDRAALSDSETRKPRTRFRSAPSRRRAKSTTEEPESNWSPSHTELLPPRVPRLNTAVHRESAASVDGRHALNYGPATALDDMLSDIRMLSQESESEIETFDPEVNVPSPVDVVGVRQRRARTQRRPDKKGGRRRKKRKHDLDEMDNGEEGPSTEMPTLLRCPVCLDVFYNAHSLSPCGHVFCEPCLRHLAKCSRDSMRHTTCPVCRDPIESCSPNQEISGLVEFYRADDYSRRHRLEKNNKYMRHPLPSSYPEIFSPKHQLSRIVSRLDRTRLARRRTRIGTTPIRLNFWRFVSLAFAFILFKGLLLMVMLCLYCVVYDQGLHEKLFEISLSGVFGLFRYLAMLTPKLWGFAGVFLFGAMFVVVLKYSHCTAWLKPLHDNQRTAFS